jgi:hypothetical protein
MKTEMNLLALVVKSLEMMFALLNSPEVSAEELAPCLQLVQAQIGALLHYEDDNHLQQAQVCLAGAYHSLGDVVPHVGVIDDGQVPAGHNIDLEDVSMKIARMRACLALRMHDDAQQAAAE